jgi:CRISPR-associated protein Csc1
VIIVEATTYHATLHSPLFYSSSEGVLISADRILGSTALTYSLAYNLGLLKKHYFLCGDEAVNHQYQELADIDLFVTDGKPIAANYKEETFKSTEYLSERSLTVTVTAPSGAKGDMGRFKKTDPDRMGSKSLKSPVSINKVRRYIGLAPGSTFEFTVWSKEPLPDDIFLTVGIRRSGELRLRKTELADRVHLNLYMLKEVYGIGEQPTEDEQITLFDIFNASGKFVRGSDYRKQHFLDVDFKFVDDEIIPSIFR